MQLCRARNAPRSALSLQVPSKRSVLLRTLLRARKQTTKKDAAVEVPAAPELPADVEKLSKMTKATLQHELEVRGLDNNGDKQQLANRLMESHISQESAVATTPADRVVLEQQLQDSSAASATGRRGRRSSRKGTTVSIEAQTPDSPAVAAVAAAAAADAAAVELHPADTASAAVDNGTPRRSRKTSRRASSVVSEPSADAPVTAQLMANSEQPSAAATSAPEAAPSARRGRRTSRKTTTTDPSAAASIEQPLVAAAASPEAIGSTATPAKRGRRTSRKSSVVEPEDAAAAPAVGEDVPAAALAGPRRARRSSRKSSVIDATEPVPASASELSAAASQPAKRGRRSSAKTASSTPDSTGNVAAAAPASRAKQLAQALARKEMAAHGVAATAAAAAAASLDPSCSAAPSDLLYAGSQAQSDSLLLGSSQDTDHNGSALSTASLQVVTDLTSSSSLSGSYEEVFAQVAAEEAAGLADEAQVDSEHLSFLTSSITDADSGAPGVAAAVFSAFTEAPLKVDEAPDAALDAFDHMVLSPSAATADAHASTAAAVVVAPKPHELLQHPSLADVQAAVEEPLGSATDSMAAPIEEDEMLDQALAVFDHLVLDVPAAAQQVAQQHPNLADIAAAVQDEVESPLEEDEEVDMALSAFDHLLIDPPMPRPTTQHPDLADIVAAAAEDSLDGSSSPLEEDEEADAVLTAFDHIAIDPPAPKPSDEHPDLADIVAAAAEDSLDGSSSPLEEDEEADAVLTAFDHIVIDPPAPTPSDAQPSLADIAAAVQDDTDSPLEEDEEADTALGAFDHMDLQASAVQANAAPSARQVVMLAVAAASDAGAASSSYDQAFLDPLQPLQAAGGGSGSLDEADAAEQVAATAAAAAAAGRHVLSTEAAVVPTTPAAAEQPGLGQMLQNWVASIAKLFEDWQKSLSK